ncbi:MAG: hypothetical protein E5X38_07290 [Mesorhizobium sp.]|uniref:hypothetical protein n=1 Tax=unclassified Mesorhizobium TaxID=325217 RepID=UPI000FCA5536|nr:MULTISPECIES: hypothetical protein [unclassified Mesorhizobium]RUV15819.1 hypothetical protein EOA91_20985 [Mesorhizobium sp. M1A.F.Ca.IN.022.04.1.1]RUV63504.1 hypothetical protein EOA64_08835 [Mesorhizobium sp. M1A.F.Ca.IN.022.02.1.1]RWG36210.1 MAG: hypothetical protein EOQ60_05080 [Mesorhizobium sp.]RWH27008.1 MAG: hypothetical protein EOQ75_03725 [Mesorhizobium sp.]TIM36093.1 MAG: hypothetical protein E5Y45_00095 [Mesorhizobium sp.]
MSWTKGKLHVEFLSRSTGKASMREVDADLCGGLAVHDALGVSTADGKQVLSVSHAATGRKVTTSYFDDRNKAVNAVTALVALPVDWTALKPASPADSHFLREAVIAICAFCGAFEVDDLMDRPGGHA